MRAEPTAGSVPPPAAAVAAASVGVLVPTPAKAPPWKAAETSSSRPSRTVPAPTTTSTTAEPVIRGSWRRKVRMRIEPEDSPTV